ncbi:MAG: hypothetical protein A3I68_00735 [Candidatus Melainabacteria bacterium RIFCSPLOWO2_02_FULL_35_15]|nr:MAG: hypothetical protein A3F80_05595 [Candidatus Melainabacteria bacterium RIFCSPLOWO2_12_FULL_35_11]OGI13437.1 MAG: hypothetical protein A3I68_00735 [Candidatus Melainabacteria bacterium RIFCSPLOWO2_02_FULL_35_15]
MKIDFKTRYFANPAGDILGGLTTGVVALPMALAFGVASGLGAEAGLYGAMAAGIFAALFGGTPAQVSGPTGPMTVVTATIVAGHLGRPELVFAAVILAGIFQIIFGLVKTGQLIRYVPYPVISGFMSGIGLIIIILQINPLFGLKTFGDVGQALRYFTGITKDFNLNALLIGLLAILIIYFFPFITKKIPAPLVSLIICSLASVYFKLDLPRIGEIPHGLPLLKFPLISISELHLILPSAISLAILGSIDSLLTSIVMDRLTGKRHHSDQEQIGQGIGNIVAGLTGGLPGAGATMRSLVNLRSGGTTHLGGIIHGLFLLAVLLYLGPVASLIPLSCLAGILITVGVSIIDYKGLKDICKIPKEDAIVMFCVLALTVFVDLIVAVAVGIALASVLFAKKLSDQSLSTHSSFDNLEHLHEISEHIPSEFRKRIYTYTFNGPLFFGEVKNFNIAIEKMKDIKYLIIKFYNVPTIDQTGIYALEDAIEFLAKNGVKVFFVGITPPIKVLFEKIGSIKNIDAICFDSLEAALLNIKQL